MPKRRYYIDTETRTVPIFNKRMQLQGRRRTKPQEKSDMTRPIREIESGRIFGRVSKGITRIPVLPSGKKSFPTRGTSSRRGTVIRRRI